VAVSILSYSKIEALLTSTVIGWPSASAARGQQRLHLILAVRSACTACACRPIARISATVASAASALPA
jgi:hypothetical protein